VIFHDHLFTVVCCLNCRSNHQKSLTILKNGIRCHCWSCCRCWRPLLELLPLLEEPDRDTLLRPEDEPEPELDPELLLPEEERRGVSRTLVPEPEDERPEEPVERRTPSPEPLRDVLLRRLPLTFWPEVSLLRREVDRFCPT